jgi:hypothetical protein
VKPINADPFAAQHPQAVLGQWVYYPKTKICGLVIGVDNQTGFMQVHDFKTMKLRWVTMNNFGQYTLVYWLRIRRQGSVKNNLLELVELETK